MRLGEVVDDGEEFAAVGVVGVGGVEDTGPGLVGAFGPEDLSGGVENILAVMDDGGGADLMVRPADEGAEGFEGKAKFGGGGDEGVHIGFPAAGGGVDGDCEIDPGGENGFEVGSVDKGGPGDRLRMRRGGLVLDPLLRTGRAGADLGGYGAEKDDVGIDDQHGAFGALVPEPVLEGVEALQAFVAMIERGFVGGAGDDGVFMPGERDVGGGGDEAEELAGLGGAFPGVFEQFALPVYVRGRIGTDDGVDHGLGDGEMLSDGRLSNLRWLWGPS